MTAPRRVRLAVLAAVVTAAATAGTFTVVQSDASHGRLRHQPVTAAAARTDDPTLTQAGSIAPAASATASAAPLASATGAAGTSSASAGASAAASASGSTGATTATAAR